MHIQLSLYWGFLLFSILIVLIQLSPLPSSIRHKVASIFALPISIGKIRFKIGWIIVAQCIIYLIIQYHHLSHFAKPEEEEEYIEARHNRLRKKWLHEIYIHQAWIILITQVSITGLDYLNGKFDKVKEQLDKFRARNKELKPKKEVKREVSPPRNRVSGGKFKDD